MAGDNATDQFFRLYGDATGDATVNIFDLLQFRRAFGAAGTYDAIHDFNGDGVINVIDLLQFRRRFGTTI